MSDKIIMVLTLKEYFNTKTEDLLEAISQAKNREAVRDVLSCEIIKKIANRIRNKGSTNLVISDLRIVFYEKRIEVVWKAEGK